MNVVMTKEGMIRREDLVVAERCLETDTEVRLSMEWFLRDGLKLVKADRNEPIPKPPEVLLNRAQHALSIIALEETGNERAVVVKWIDIRTLVCVQQSKWTVVYLTPAIGAEMFGAPPVLA